MFLIPIGHEDLGVRRLPWVTIGIAIVCAIVQVNACAVEAEIETGLEGVVGDMDRLLETVADDCLRRKTCSLPTQQPIEGVKTGLRDHTLGTSYQQARFAALDASLSELMSRHPVTRFGLRPNHISIIRLFTSPFAHGGFAHLIGNMLFLYIVGVTIEERWGRWRFLIFYLLGGAVSGLAYCAVHAGGTMPLVGASGAIAAAMGAFVILYARTRIQFFYVIFLIRTGTFTAPAWLVLPLWFLEQLISVSGETSGEDNVGYSAHIGGFLLGAATALVIRYAGLDRRFQEDVDVATGGWVQDPLVEEARALTDRGDLRAAQGKLAQALAKHPDDQDSRELAFDLANRASNGLLMQRHAAHLFPSWAKSEPRRVLDSYQRITELADQTRATQIDGTKPGPASRVDERILDWALTAASAACDLSGAQSATQQLARDYPNSPLVPRALWVLAEIHGHQGHSEQQASLLDRLIRNHPGTVWSDRAQTSHGKEPPA